MNLIAGVVGAALQPLLLWLATFFTRKLTTITITLSSFAFLTAAFIVCLKYIIVTVLALAVVPAWLIAGVGLFVPFNFVAILSSIMSAQSCRWAYDKAMEKIKMINEAV